MRKEEALRKVNREKEREAREGKMGRWGRKEKRRALLKSYMYE